MAHRLHLLQLIVRPPNGGIRNLERYCMSSHSRAGGQKWYVSLPICLRRHHHQDQRTCNEQIERIKQRGQNLQYGKLAWFNNEDWSEHESNTGSKHRQGCN